MGKKGSIVSKEVRLKISNTLKGRTIPDNVRKKISLNHARVWLGKSFSDEHRKKMSLARIGIKLSKETCMRMSLSKRGKDHPNWKGGVSPLHKRIKRTKEYISWRTQIFERDNYTCQECGRHSMIGDRVILHPHHIKQFAYIVKEMVDSNIGLDNNELTDLSKTYKPLLNLSNGLTLCKECHSKTDSCRKRLLNGGG